MIKKLPWKLPGIGGLLLVALPAGNELGNHSFTHPSFQKMDLISYEDDVLRGDLAPRLIMAEADRPVRYFRHPYNQTGPSTEIKAWRAAQQSAKDD